jgi:hypothetical protein
MLSQFLSKGNIPGNVKLIDGDVIVIPPSLGYAAIIGKINNFTISYIIKYIIDNIFYYKYFNSFINNIF